MVVLINVFIEKHVQQSFPANVVSLMAITGTTIEKKLATKLQLPTAQLFKIILGCIKVLTEGN